MSNEQPPQPPSGALPPSGTLPPAASLPPAGAPQAAAPKKPNMIGRIAIGCLGMFALACVAIGGLVFFQTWQQQQNYNAGHAAYLKADCKAAVGPLGKAASGDPGDKASDVAVKAQAELEECEALSAAQDLAAGSAGEAVMALTSFVGKYDQSPLRDTALASAKELAASNDPEALAAPELCRGLDEVSALGVFATPDETFPPLLYACGQAFEAEESFTDAIIAYDRFRQTYPDHPLFEDVSAAFARATIADAQANGSGALPPPQAIGDGSGASGEVTVIIQNDAPDKLSLVFSGPETRVEELEACADCEKFSGDGPEACPELGPVGTYTLKPGSYTVVVKSGSGADVTPFSGTWDLEGGQEYSSCFYIVTR